MTGTPGLFWAWRGSSVVGGLGLAVAVAALVLLVPGGWYVARRRLGSTAAGPLWPLLTFVALAGLYALLVPPWQMPDEPQHMVHVEVVRRAGFGAPEQLLPFRSPPPRVARIDADVQRQIVVSMRQTHATRWLHWARRDLAAGKVPGPTELPHPPLYYDVTAVLLRPFGSMPVIARLALLRFLGVVLAAGVVWCCGAAGRLLFPGRPWAEAAAAVAVAVPSFAAFAGAVNNDALALLLAAALVLLLLVGVLDANRLARPGLWLPAVIALLVLGLLTKRTFVPLLPVALVAAACRVRWRASAVIAGLVGIGVLAGAFVAVGGQPRLATWHRATTTGTNRCRGGHRDTWAICLTPASYQVSQNVALVDARRVEGGQVRAAAWVRGAHSTFSLDVDTNWGHVAHAEQEAGPDWQYVVASGQMPARPTFLSVALTAKGTGTVRVDGVTLGPLAHAGAAGRADDANYVTNGNGAAATLSAPSLLPNPVRRALDGAADAVDGVARRSGTVVDSLGIMAGEARQSFASFWATVGWPPMPLFPFWLELVIAALVAGGVAGFVVVVVRRTLPVRAAIVLAATIVCVTAAGVLRTVPPTDAEPRAGRYLFPAMVAFAVVLAAGWHRLWPVARPSFRTAARVSIPVLHGLFVAILLAPYLR